MSFLARLLRTGFHRLPRTFALVAFGTILLLGAEHTHAQVVATYDFEDGTAQGWGSFFNATTPGNTTAEAYTGTHSLSTTTSASGTGGPSIHLNGILLPGAQYTITGWVRLGAGATSANANFTIQRSDPACSGGTCYDTIGGYQVAVTNNGWAQIGGTYKVSATATGFLLYEQLVGASSAVGTYLDDVVITETAAPPNGTVIATYNFSDQGLDGWFPFGSPTLSNVASPIPDPLSDARSLLVSNRTGGYMGPALNLLSVNGITAGATYQITAYVMLAAPDASSPTISMSLKTADCATSGSYSSLATTGAVANTSWTKVQGSLTFTNQPGPPTNLTLYFQSSSATDSFYLSGVTIAETAPAPPSPSQQDNTGISTVFEDGGTDGWSGRGAATVANSTATAHGGTHSLLTTGRTANWNGPSISVANKMYVGSVYNISVWVKLLPTDASSHILNVSLQTNLAGTASFPSVTSYPGITVNADGNWHQISVLGYNMSNAYDSGGASLYVQTVPASGNDLVSFYIDDFQLTYVNPPSIQTNIPSIAETLSPFFPVGAATDSTDLIGAHAQLFSTHFKSMTPGNELKWSSVEANRGVYTFTNGDALVGEAVCTGSLVRGQNLVWANAQQTPSYATGDGTNSPANQATVVANIQEHIQSEVQHFGTNVYAWDVINEPIDPSQPDCLVHGPFYKVLGKSYIDVAFQAARQFAPAGTKLFLNEYSTSDPGRLACLESVVQDLVDRGIPIDGIGHEMHVAINYPSVTSVAESINTLYNKFPQLDQQVTEMDISVYNAGNTTSNYGTTIPAGVLAEQGWLYKKYFDAFKLLSGKLKAVTLWGMADDDTWLDSFPVSRTDYPLPFDMSLQAKPAYWGIVDYTRLPGYGLAFSMTASGTGKQRTLNYTASNGVAGTAYATTITGVSVAPVVAGGCTPTLATSTPLLIGDVAAGGKGMGKVTLNFGSTCKAGSYVVTTSWSVATYDTGSLRSVITYTP